MNLKKKCVRKKAFLWQEIPTETKVFFPLLSWEHLLGLPFNSNQQYSTEK